MKSNIIFVLFLWVAISLSVEEVRADPLDVENLLPDFYSDPSLSASVGYFGDAAQVTIDKFSGKLIIRVEDMVIPGNGGLDIVLQRTYTSLDPGVIPEYSYLGAGWNMHYGQIRIIDPDKMCSRLWSTTMSGNPVYVAGDGSTRSLAFVTLPVSADLGAEYVSSKNDLVYCNQDGTFYMRSPNGRRYDFDAFSYEPDTAYPAVWYVTKVTDRNGNTLDISYVPTGTLGGMGMVMSQISASDGRVVTFTYQGVASDSPLLAGISYDGDDWVYSYTSGDFGDAGRTRYLSQVTNPEGLSWVYDYWPYNGAGTSGAGSLRSETNPHGGVHEFTYGLQQFNADVLDTTWNIVITQHQRRNGTLPVSSETYAYSQTASSAVSDTTTVTSDDGVTHYRHFGISGGQSGTVWKIGLLDSVEYIPVSGVPSVERYYWEGQQVSQETYKRNRGTGLYVHFDDRYRIPYLTEKRIERESRTYVTQYSDFFTQGWHPAPQLYQTITRIGPSGTREEGIRFFYDLDKWIVGIVRQWNYGQRIAFLYNMDTNGNVIEAFENGRWAYYSRTPEGDIASEQIGDNDPIAYSNHEYGKAGNVSFPDGGFIERDMDSYGRVVREENVNSVTSWTYDAIGRLESVVPAASAPITLSWSTNSVEIARQGYENIRHFDGFGRVYQEQISGTGAPGITIERSYDHDDRIVEEVINGSEFGYAYDGYGRLLGIEHDDGEKTFSYGPGSKTIEDETGNLVTYSYATYSSPDEGEMESIQVDDLDEIEIERNSAGEVIRVSQADIQRLYSYYNYNQLASIHDPEAGEVVYGYDTAGNISVAFLTPELGGQSGLNLHYQYDDMNRKVGMNATAYIQEPLDDLQDTIVRNRWSETYTYDTVGNMLVSERNRNEEVYEYIPALGGYYLTDILDHPVAWQMSYDAEGRLLSESLHVDTNQFSLAYAYSLDGHLSSTTYPSGEVVLHNPNSYGWPLSAGNYVTVSGYHVNGTPSAMQFGNGDIYSSTVDGYHRLSGFRVDAGSTALMNHVLGYDPAGNLISVADLNSSSNTVSLSYDGANQLVSASGFWGTKSIDYDGLGNILSVSDGVNPTLYQYDIDNRLTAVSGAVTRNYSYPDYYFGAVGGNGIHDLKRDINNQLYKYQPAGFYSGWTIMEHDARGRVAKTFTDNGDLEYSMYGTNGKLMFQWDGQDDYKEYIYLGQRLVAERTVAQ